MKRRFGMWMILMVSMVLTIGIGVSAFAQDVISSETILVNDSVDESPMVTHLNNHPLAPLKGGSASLKAESDNPFDVIDDIKNADDWIDLVGLDGAVLTLLMIVLGYLSKFIPILNKINSNTYRVLTTGIIVIIGLAMFGPSGAMWKGIIAYLISTSTYEVLLKWIFKTPKPQEAGQSV